MAVYERSYATYQGPMTPTWARFLVIPSYAYREVFKTRLFTPFFTLCFSMPLAKRSVSAPSRVVRSSSMGAG